jgi:cysteine desulfurase
MNQQWQNKNKSIYLDYAATTPADPRVIEVMLGYLAPDTAYGNPASRSHSFGWDADAAVTDARQKVADLLHCEPAEIVWTSGATESDNLAIKGVAHFHQRKGKHIITSKIEHKAVLDTCRFLEKEGFDVTYVSPDAKGVIQPQTIKDAIRDDTILISIMHINNEMGSIQDIAAIGELARENKIIFHVDAAQSLGKIDIDLQTMKVDLMSFSSHKIYGPKGMGALFVRRRPRIRLEAQMHGGGHERGLRSGTLPTHQIAGFAEACHIAGKEMHDDLQRITKLRDQLWNGVKDLEEVYVNGDLAHGYPGILNVSFNFVEGESLVMALKELAVSSGSACTSASLEPSYVLRALGLNDELAHSSIRFSIGRFTTEEQITRAVETIRQSIQRLRDMSPLWEMHQQGIDLAKVKWAAHE